MIALILKGENIRAIEGKDSQADSNLKEIAMSIKNSSKYWCVFNADNIEQYWSLSPFKSKSIELFLSGITSPGNQGWKFWYYKNYRCRRVNIIQDRHDVMTLHDPGTYLIKITEHNKPMVIEKA